QLARRTREVALIEEREEGVFYDGLADGLAALDLATEIHLLADSERALGEIALARGAADQHAQRAGGDAVCLQEVAHHARVEADPTAPIEALVAVAERHGIGRA